MVLTLTPAGRALHARTVALVKARSRRLFGCLSEAEQRTLSELFDRLIAHNRRAPRG